jgi:hypothetical protein
MLPLRAYMIISLSTLRIIQRLMLIAVLNMIWSTIFAICDLVLVSLFPSVESTELTTDTRRVVYSHGGDDLLRSL